MLVVGVTESPKYYKLAAACIFLTWIYTCINLLALRRTTYLLLRLLPECIHYIPFAWSWKWTELPLHSQLRLIKVGPEKKSTENWDSFQVLSGDTPFLSTQRGKPYEESLAIDILYWKRVNVPVEWILGRCFSCPGRYSMPVSYQYCTMQIIIDVLHGEGINCWMMYYSTRSTLLGPMTAITYLFL